MKDLRSFHGNLSLISFANLLQLIKLATLSGHLAVNCAENASHFIFADGKLSYGFTREGRKKIGQHLIESRLITAEQLKSSLEQQKMTERWEKLGYILVKNGYLTQLQLTDVFYRQAKAALFETLAWTQGTFMFTNTSPLVEGDIVLEESIDKLILQGLVLLDELRN